MKRREFITLLGGAAARGRSRRARSRASGCGAIGVLMASAADDPEAQARIAAFLQGLQQLGWIVGRNVRIDIAGRQATTSAFANTRRNWLRSRRTSLWPVAAKPWRRCSRLPAQFRSCLRVSPTPSAPASSRAWRGRAATPPVSSNFEYSISGKWLELLKEIAPRITRVAVLRDAAIAAGSGQLGAIQSVAPRWGWNCARSACATPARSNAAVAAFASASNGGLIVTASAAGWHSSRPDHHVGGPAQATRGLLESRLCRPAGA